MYTAVMTLKRKNKVWCPKAAPNLYFRSRLSLWTSDDMYVGHAYVYMCVHVYV
jgi:hypothetical protein